jgi:hypothetical protein
MSLLIRLDPKAPYKPKMQKKITLPNGGVVLLDFDATGKLVSIRLSDQLALSENVVAEVISEAMLEKFDFSGELPPYEALKASLKPEPVSEFPGLPPGFPPIFGFGR